MDPLAEDPTGKACLRNFKSAVFKAVADVALARPPTVAEFEELTAGLFRDIVNGVQEELVVP